MNLSDFAILSIKCSDYWFIVSEISENEDINLLQKADLTEKSGILYKRMGKGILTFGDIEMEWNKFYHYKSLVRLRDVDIEKALVSHKITFGIETINTLLVTCIMIIKLSHYI